MEGYHKFSYGLRRKAASAGELTRNRRGSALSKTSKRGFERFLALENPEGKWGGMLYCMFKMRTNKRFLREEKNAGG